MKYAMLFVAVFLICSVTASDYYIEFNQFEDKLVVVEINNGNKTTYVLENELEPANNGYIFLEEIIAKENFDKFRISLVLEKNVFPNLQQTFPDVDKIEFGDATTKLSWDYYNVSRGEEFAFFVLLQDNSLKFKFIFYIIFSFLIIIFIFLFLRYAFKKKTDINKYLLEEEQKIIKFLKSSNRHESWQRKIQETFNLSKAKTSRLIKNLESRNILEKIPFGNTNKIRLK